MKGVRLELKLLYVLEIYRLLDFPHNLDWTKGVKCLNLNGPSYVTRDIYFVSHSIAQVVGYLVLKQGVLS